MRWNLVKHGYMQQAADWPYSSFHRYVKAGHYPENWAGMPDTELDMVKIAKFYGTRMRDISSDQSKREI